MRTPFRQELLSGTVFLTLLAGGLAAGLYYLPDTLRNTETPATQDLIGGKWQPRFEKALGDALPIGPSSRDLWGAGEFAAFHEGRKGVVVGDNGWLFTSEEFSCPAHAEQNLGENLDFIKKTVAALNAKNVKVVVALVPAKSRVFPDYLGRHNLPECRTGLYGHVLDNLAQRGIPAANVLAAMDAGTPHDGLYLKADTHWSPQGAQLAAETVAAAVHDAYGDAGLPTDKFSSTQGPSKPHDGDLARYLPGVAIPAEAVATYKTTAAVAVAGAGAMNGLLDDAPAPLAVLVGTSYSANADWNFAGFLKEALKSDVLNAAEEGQGPFAVMDKYLEGKAWQDNPPRLLVWEIPERYLLMPHGVAP